MKLDEMINELGASGYQKDNWNGYTVYVPVFNNVAYTGLPVVILEKDGDFRLSDSQETFDYFDYAQSKTNNSSK